VLFVCGVSLSLSLSLSAFAMIKLLGLAIYFEKNISFLYSIYIVWLTDICNRTVHRPLRVEITHFLLPYPPLVDGGLVEGQFHLTAQYVIHQIILIVTLP
jgi:hypothetical protein